MTDLHLPAVAGDVGHGWLAALGLTRLLAETWPEIALSWDQGHAVLHDGPDTVDQAARAAWSTSIGRVPDGAVLPGVAPGWPPPGARRTSDMVATGEPWPGPAAASWPGPDGARWQATLISPAGRLHPLIRLHAAQTLHGVLAKMVTELRQDPDLVTKAITGLGLTGRYRGGLWLLRRTIEAVDSPTGTPESQGSPGRDWLALMSAPWMPAIDPPEWSAWADMPVGAVGWRSERGRWDGQPALAWSLWTDPVPAAAIPMMLGWDRRPQLIAYRRRRGEMQRYDPPMLVPARPEEYAERHRYRGGRRRTATR